MTIWTQRETEIDAAFRRDACADPHDDAVRLIHADWLDEHGEEARAEFIRAQIEYAKLAGCEGADVIDCPRCRLWGRTRAMLTPANFWRFTKPLRPLWPGLPTVIYESAGPAPGEMHFCHVRGAFRPLDVLVGWRRGGIEFARLSAYQFLVHFDVLFAHEPVLDVHLTDCLPEQVAGGYEWVLEPDNWRRRLREVLDHVRGRAVRPDCSFGLMERLEFCTADRQFATREDACDAFSAVLVNWARPLVGLAPLPPLPPWEEP